MPINLINIGYGNLVSASRIIAIVAPESAPSKRLISYARDCLLYTSMAMITMAKANKLLSIKLVL